MIIQQPWEEEKMNSQELQLQYLDQARNANQKRMRRYVETLRQVADASGTKPDNSSADRFSFSLQPNKVYFCENTRSRWVLPYGLSKSKSIHIQH